MGALQWKYKIQAYVEETASHAKNKKFSTVYLEGQSRTGHPFPLNQVEIKGGDLGSNVKVIVSPRVTQVYFFVNDISDMEELESIMGNLGEVEQILNEVVIFAPNETARFGIETEIPVMSYSMLKAQQKVLSKFHEAIDKLGELVLEEIVQAFIFLAKGKIGYGMKRIEVFLRELTKVQRNLIQWAKDQGIKEAEKWERELNEIISSSRRLENELASAKSPLEIENILEKYWASLLKRY